MPSLADILLTAKKRGLLVADGARLVESRVARRGGLSGAAVKTGLALLKKARPDILARAVDRMLPEFLAALEPLHQEFRAAPAPARGSKAGDFGDFLAARRDAAARALLAVADARVGASHNAAAKSIYARLRGSAEHEVQEAMPELAAILSQHLPA